MKIYLIITLFITQLSQVYNSRCSSHPHEIETNDHPIWDSEPILKKQVYNGNLYQVGSSALNNTIDMIHVQGTPYEMGRAEGALLGNRIQEFMDSVYQYIIDDVSDDLPDWMPESLKEDIIIFGGSAALDLTYQMTVKYTNPIYYEELQGMCETSGANYDQARRVQLIGELTKGHCSMLGAWGQSTTQGQTIQLRTLDWEFEDGPFAKYPVITVYHPSDPQYGNKWANVGLMGFLGSLSGFNEYKMGISEIGVSYPDTLPSEAPSFGKESREGNPFTFVLRDILQFTKNLDEAIDFLENTQRTCNLILGVGDAQENSDKHFRAFQYSYSVCNVIGDENLIPKADWHPEIKDTVYFGMDWNCPNWDIRFAELLNEYYGQIDGDLMVKKIVPGLTSGNLQIVVYDLAQNNVYISYGYQDGDYISQAYQNGFVKLNVQELFSEKYI